jgi:hypothetical protein
LLDGDYSDWPSVVSFKRIISGPIEGETIEAWSLTMKRKLADALAERNYVLVKQLCWSLKLNRVNLTREEKAGYRLATREIEKKQRQ